MLIYDKTNNCTNLKLTRLILKAHLQRFREAILNTSLFERKCNGINTPMAYSGN